MTLRKRLRVLWAAAYQEWHEFECPSCHQTSWLCGHYPDLNGMLCQTCESDEHEKWMNDFFARQAGQQRSA